MLGKYTLTATIAVSNLSNGKDFYGNTLGLEQIDENFAGVTYKTGETKLFVYESDTAGSGKATCAAWAVPDVEDVAAQLKEKNTSFVQLDSVPEGVTEDNDIYTMGEDKVAWFKDPDGNILAIGNM